MKLKSTRRFSIAFPLACAIAGIVASASAATITWDANGATALQTDGAGVWLAANQWWDGVGSANVNWTTGDDAVFGNAGAGGAVTLASPTTVNSLTLNSFTGTYTLGTAGQTITLTNGITKNTAVGAATIISPITFGAAQSWVNNSVGLLTVGTGAVTNAGFLLNLGGSGNTTVTSVISGAGGLTKSDAGLVTLSGANTYGGVTTINGGVLAAATLANGGATSAIGNSSNAATSLIFGAPSATLRHTGAAVTTNRGFTLSSGAGGGATIEASGTGALSFDNTVAIAYGTADQTRTLTLGGANTASTHVFGKALADNGAGATSLVKNGAGTWVLNATNTYTGGSTVSLGALVFRTLLSKSSGGTHAFGAGTTLGLGVGGDEFTTTDVDNAFSGTITGNLSNVTVTGTTNVGIDTTAGTLDYSTTIGSVSRGLTKLGTNTLTLSGTNAYTGVTTLAGGGTLTVGTLANTGSNSSIGNFATAGATGLVLSGGTFNYTGASVTTDRGFTVNGATQTIISVGTGVNLNLGASVKSETASSTSALTFSAAGAGSSITVSSLIITAGTNPDFNIAGSLPTVTIQNLNVSGFNVIANRSGDTNSTMLNVGNIIGTGASGWLAWLNVSGAISGYTGQITLGNNVTLTGLSSFDVPIVIQQGGIYTFNTIKNWGVGASSSALGAPTTLANGTIGFGNGVNTPTFRYTGTGDTTNRVLNLRGTATLNLEQAGTGNLLFTANTTAAASTKTLNLTGSTAGTGEFSGIIADNSVSNKTNLTKSGTGTWTLSGANTYTGTTTVNTGTLALVGGSQTSPISVTANGTLGFTLGSPTTSTSTVNFAGGSKVAITGTASSPTEYLLMTASNITGAPTLTPALPGYFIEIRNGGTELWLDFNPNIQAHVINLGAGTTIVGETFGTYSGPLTGLPLPTLPVGTILRSVAVSTTMTATDAGNLASDLTLLFDPTPGTPGGDFNLAFAASDVSPPVFGTNDVLAWPAIANGGAGTALVDFKTEAAWTGLVGAIDLSTTGVFLGNNFGTAPQGGTWSGTITLTYELPGSPPNPYDTWATDKGLTLANKARNLDPDHDGRNNLAEFAFDGNPLSGANDGKVVGKVAMVEGQPVLTLTLPARTGAAFSNSGGDQLSALVNGVIYRIEGDVNLSIFADTIAEVTGGDSITLQTGLPALSSGWTYRTFRAPGTVPTAPKAFLRAKISETP